MKARHVIIGALALIFAALIGYRGYTVSLQAYRGAVTGDNMGFIEVAMGKTLNLSNADGWDAYAETVQLFPSIPARNHEILDGWGNPMRVTLKKIGASGHWQIISAGPDGIFGTEDDLAMVGDICSQTDDAPPAK